MTQWVTQAEAVRLLADLGDTISQQALSLYLKGHPEVVREQNGRSVRIDWDSLKRSRGTRSARGPASQSPLFEEAEPTRPTETALRAPRDPEAADLSARRARADTDRAESDARRAKILAAEAEGRVIGRDAAINAFVTAGIALVRAMEEGRVLAVDEIRAAVDNRSALQAMKVYERNLRTTFANTLTDFAQAEEPALAAAE